MAGDSSLKIEDSRILITGGLGFVGSAIAERLLKEGAGEVRLFDLREESPFFYEDLPEKNRLRLVVGDIRSREEVMRAVRGCDYVFHKAALRVTRCAKELRQAHEILIDGTFNVIEACLENDVKKLIHASSAIIYGEPVRLPLDEEHPTHDTTTYGIFKVANENLLKSCKKNSGLDYLALRYFNIYGPGMNLFGPDTEVLARWLERLDAGLPPLIFGDGSQTLDWIYIDDVVEANWLALHSKESGEAFNVCTGRETSLLEALRLLLRIRGSHLRPEFRESRPINHVSRRFGNPEKAWKRLRFRAEVSFEKGMEAFVKWRDSVLAKKNQKGVASSVLPR